jgi:predicted Zn-dependent protease
MAIRKKGSGSSAEAPEQDEQYQALLARYGQAIESLRGGDWARAQQELQALAKEHPEEQELADRARTWLRICERKLAPETDDPSDPDEAYTRAVVLMNNGSTRHAIRLLDRCLQNEPASVRFLYARASAHALEGRAEPAVADLRQAIALDPKVRYQAVNDTDFERIREEPSFIDVIEPTPTGA